MGKYVYTFLMLFNFVECLFLYSCCNFKDDI